MSFQKNKRHLVIVGFIIIVILPILQDVITNVISSIIFEKYIQGFVDKYFPDKNWLFYLFLIGSMIIIAVISILVLCHTSKETSSTDLKKRPLEIQDVPVAIDRSKFKGRNQDLERLHQGLEKHRIFAILGMPGVGKSELAKQYAHNKEYKKRYEYIIWISSELADQTAVKEYWSSLSEISKPILVIFHDCYNFEELKNSLPSQPYIKILITSPQSIPASYVNDYHPLQPLSEKAAIALLRYNLEPRLPGKVDTEIRAVKGLCNELGNLPILLKAASDYLQQPWQRFSDLRDVLQADAGNFSDINYNNDLQIQEIIDKKALKIYDQLWSYLSEKEKKLAYCISFFASAQIPGFLIDEFGDIISNLINLNDSTSIKYGYNQLRSIYLNTPPNKENQSLKDLKQKITIVPLHPIVRRFFKVKREEFINELDNEQLENPEREFCYIMAAIAKEIPQDAKRNGIPLMKDLMVPHLEASATLILNTPDSATWFDETDDDDEAVTLLEPFIGLAKFYNRIGQTDKAKQWLKRCGKFLSDNLGQQAPLYTRYLYNLACLDNEEEQYYRALESATNNLEPNHKIKAGIHKDFGLFYDDTQKDYQRATEQFKAAIRIYSSHATSSEQYYRQKIICQCYLAQAECYLRNFKAADKFYASSELERFIEQLQSSDNKQDKIDCSRIEYERAECYRLRKDFYQGAHHSHKALKIREKYLQDETAVAQSLIQLAQIVKIQDKFREAEGYYARALTIYKKDPQISNESLSKIQQKYDKLLREHPHLHRFKCIRDLIEKQ